MEKGCRDEVTCVVFVCPERNYGIASGQLREKSFERNLVRRIRKSPLCPFSVSLEMYFSYLGGIVG